MSNKNGRSDSIFGGVDQVGFYQALLDDMVTFVAVLDLSGTVLFVNNTPLITAGITLEEVTQDKFWNAYWWSYSDEAVQTIREDVEVCATGQNINHEIQVLTEDGSLIWIEFSMHPIYDKEGNVEFVVPEGRDVTDRKLQEEILRRSMKMDALGKLTAGIAHDYNNILSIIGGYSELISDRISGDEKLEKYLRDIQNATGRGAQLTRKLLAFTRQKISQVSTCDINEKMDGLRLMIEKTLTSKVKLTYDLENGLWPVDLDVNDLEDCVINICINAMHAMESGGQLSIRTYNIVFTDRDVRQLNIDPGAFVALSIADTGCGMDEKTIENIFDPFFSTKGEGGTGLGMSQVHGFIQRARGDIKIFSQLGHGTRVVLYFPISDSPVDLQHPSYTSIENLKGNESLLVVDDEVAIAELACEILESYGYSVTTANNADEALKILKETPIDLLITDVIMPNMSGYELATIVRQRYPSIKIQVVSGFEDDAFSNTNHALLRQNIIYKPYTSNRLLTHVRVLLDDKKTEIRRTVMLVDDDIDYCTLFEIKLDTIDCDLIITHSGDQAIENFENSLGDSVTIDLVVLDLNMSEGDGGVKVAQKILELSSDAIVIVSSGDTACDEMLEFARYGFTAALDKRSNPQAIKELFDCVAPLAGELN